MKATSSGVAFSAAKMRSPSFSRSSSSMTTTALPAAMSATARSTESNLVIVATSSVPGVRRERCHQNPPEALKCCLQYEPRRRQGYCRGLVTSDSAPRSGWTVESTWMPSTPKACAGRVSPPPCVAAADDACSDSVQPAVIAEVKQLANKGWQDGHFVDQNDRTRRKHVPL